MTTGICGAVAAYGLQLVPVSIPLPPHAPGAPFFCFVVGCSGTRPPAPVTTSRTNLFEFRALLDLASAATRRGDHEFAITTGHRALSLCMDPSNRERLIGCVAAAFLKLHMYEAARDTFVAAAANAQEKFVRWVAYNNLAWIAGVHFRDRSQFNEYASVLAQETLPPSLGAAWQLTIGESLLAFGDTLGAKDAFTRGLSIAAEHGLNEWVIDADRLVAQMRGQESSATEAPPHGTLAEVARAMKELAAAASAK